MHSLHRYVRTYVHTYIHTYIHLHTYVLQPYYIHTYHTHTHTHTHTHKTLRLRLGNLHCVKVSSSMCNLFISPSACANKNITVCVRPSVSSVPLRYRPGVRESCGSGYEAFAVHLSVGFVVWMAAGFLPCALKLRLPGTVLCDRHWLLLKCVTEQTEPTRVHYLPGNRNERATR